jgi:hypothetical protein
MLSIREPRRFYALVPRDASPWPALAYGLAFEVVVAALTFAYHEAFGAAELRASLAGFTPALREVMPSAPALIERTLGASALASLVLTPLSYLLELLGTAAVAWVGLRLTRNLHTSFGVLVRMFAYASWIHVFGVLGVTGDVILSSLSFLLTFGFGSYYWLVVVRQSQRIDTKQAVWASLAGGLVAMVFACVFGLPPLIALMVWGISNVELPKLTP